MKDGKSLRGYLLSREADGQIISQRVQNMLIRDYVESSGYRFVLSAVEYYMENCYMMLDSLLEKINEVDGLVFFSLAALPREESKRKSLLKTILENKKELHFALENVCIKTEKDVEGLNEILTVRCLSENTKEIIEQLNLGTPLA